MTVQERPDIVETRWHENGVRDLWRLSRSDVALVAGLTLLAGLLRFATLSHQSFWLDEGYTERLVHASFTSMLSSIPRTESTPPVYYVCAWIWTRLFGFSEFGLRSLSAVAGTLTVLVTYAIGRRIANRTVALIAGLLVAASPLLVWFSQEARAYALATLLASLTVLFLLRYREARATKDLGCWTIAAALGIATHYFVGFLVVPELIWLFVTYRRDGRVRLAGAGVVLVAAALSPLALAQRGTGHADYIAKGSLITRLLQIPKQLFIGYASPHQVISAVVVAALVVAALAGLFRRARHRDSQVLLVVTVAVTGLVAPIVLAVCGIDFLNTRNLLPCAPLLMVVVAVGLEQLGPKYAALLTAILVGTFLTVVLLVDTYPRFERDNWRGASRTLGAPEGLRVILVRPASGLIPLGVYQHGLVALRRPVNVAELDIVALPPHPVGGGMGAIKDLRPTSIAPPGFVLAGWRRSSTFFTLRFKASHPAAIGASMVDAARSRGFAILLQPAG